MNKLNAIVIRIVADAFIPLLGFFVWNWSLFFILLYYALDLLASEVIMHFKSNKILKVAAQNQKSKYLLFAATSFLFLGLVFFTALFLMQLRMQQFSLESEIISFLSYEDMGIQQGYVLLPLIAFASYQNYKMEFLMTGKFKTASISGIWKLHIISLLIILISVVLFTLLPQSPDWLILMIIVVLNGIFTLVKFRYDNKVSTSK